MGAGGAMAELNQLAAISLADLDGTNGFRLDGIDADDRSGASVAGRGRRQRRRHRRPDRRRLGADPDGKYDAGESYVVFGTDAGFAASLDLAALDGGERLPPRRDRCERLSGVSVAGAGDVNGDGIDDLIVGAPLADPGRQI